VKQYARRRAWHQQSKNGKTCRPNRPGRAMMSLKWLRQPVQTAALMRCTNAASENTKSPAMRHGKRWSQVAIFQLMKSSIVTCIARALSGVIVVWVEHEQRRHYP
jgi:hypothetical protein